MINSYYKCPICGTQYSILDRFPKSQSKLYTGWENHLPICKDCVPIVYGQLSEVCENQTDAIRHFCERFDIYFNLGLAKTSLEKSQNPMTYYISKSNSLPQYKNKSYQDTVSEEYIKTIDSIEELEKDTDCDIDTETVKFFGTGFTDDDYRFLQDEYDDWTTRNECKTKSQELIFKRICFKELEIQKATKTGVSTKDLDKSLQELLDSGNLKPKQTNMDALAEDRTFGQLIRIWENEKPIPEPDPEFRDVDNIGRYISVFFLGHLAKMVGIKNKYARMYEDEMSKYTVQKPEYEEDSEALFDAIFGNHLENSGD